MAHELLIPGRVTGPAVFFDAFDRLVDGKAVARGDVADSAQNTGRWTLVENMQGGRNRNVLMAWPGNTAPRLSFTADVRGTHAIYVGHFGANTPAHDDGLYVRIAGEPHFTRMIPDRREPVYCEGYYKTILCNGTLTIEIESFGLRSGLDYIRLVPVEAKPVPPTKFRSFGICDFTTSVLMTKPPGFEAASCVRQQQDAGFDAVIWKCFKVVCEWHTKIGVRRDLGVDYDTLRQAVDEAKKIGMPIYGWMRFNNEESKPGGLFAPETPFHRQYPHVRQARKDGQLRPRTGFAFPEVRKFKTDLVREVAAYGVDGICIDVLRHPPVVEWDLPMVESYIAKYGEDPRKEPGDGPERWLRHKSEAFTQFLRDCKAALGKTPLIVRTMDQAWRNLQAGCDVEKWFDEKLVDGVIFAAHLPDAQNYPQKLDLTPWLKLAAPSGIPVYGQVWNVSSIIEAEALAADLHEQGVAGLAVYESEYATARPGVREHLWRLNRPEMLRYRKVRE